MRCVLKRWLGRAAVRGMKCAESHRTRAADSRRDRPPTPTPTPPRRGESVRHRQTVGNGQTVCEMVKKMSRKRSNRL